MMGVARRRDNPLSEGGRTPSGSLADVAHVNDPAAHLRDVLAPLLRSEGAARGTRERREREREDFRKRLPPWRCGTKPREMHNGGRGERLAGGSETREASQCLLLKTAVTSSHCVQFKLDDFLLTDE